MTRTVLTGLLLLFLILPGCLHSSTAGPAPAPSLSPGPVPTPQRAVLGTLAREGIQVDRLPGAAVQWGFVEWMAWVRYQDGRVRGLARRGLETE